MLVTVTGLNAPSTPPSPSSITQNLTSSTLLVLILLPVTKKSKRSNKEHKTGRTHRAAAMANDSSNCCFLSHQKKDGFNDVDETLMTRSVVFRQQN